jgi:MFS family permease
MNGRRDRHVPNGDGTRPRAASLWRHPDFLRLWTADSVSQLGTQITLLALPLTAITILHATTFEVGLLTTFDFLPFILVGLPAGVWVDRMRRRPILISGDIGRAILLGSIPVAYALGVLHVAQLYVVGFLTGICTVFFDVAYQSYLPSLVERDQLVDGNGKLEMSRSGAQLAGPAVAGWLIQLLRAPIAIAADAASYAWSAAWVFRIRASEPPIEVPEDGHPPLRSEIKVGLRYVWHHALLRPIALCTANSNLWSSMMIAVLLVFAVRSLGLSAGAIGTIFAIGNVGVLLGAVSSGRLGRALGLGTTIVGAAVLFSLPAALIPLATRSTAWPLLIAAMFFTGFAGVVYNVNQVSLRQAITPLRMQGRMNATMRFLVWGTMPIGSFLGGAIGNAIGLRTTLWIAAAGGVFSFLPPLLSPVRSLRTMPEGPEEAPAGGGTPVLAAAADGIATEGQPPPARPER